MAFAANDMNLAQQIQEVGYKLAELPTEVELLLPILDRVDLLLSQVDQAPSQQLLDACSVVMKALVEEPLLKHFDNDVKVFLAACLCEVARIMAPKSPYEDPEMKEFFQLIVSSFKDLYDMSSRSYHKRMSILNNVAGVRSPVLMLDLECDSLIVEMFQNLLGSIRDYHPESIFTYMESIMTLVIEESDEVSLELLTPILGVLKKDNEDPPIISRKLGEKVLETCASKVKPYLLQAVKFLGRPISQYSAIVAHICEEAGVVEHHDDDDGSINKLAKESLDEPAPVIPLKEPSKPNDDLDNEKETLVVDEDSQFNATPSSEIEMEVAQFSSSNHIENKVVDIASEIQTDKSLFTRENSTEGAPFFDHAGVEVGNVSGALLIKQQRGSKSVNANSTEADEPMKEKMVEKDMPLTNKGSTNVAEMEVSSDDDLACKISEFIIKTQKSKTSSGKKRKGMTPNKQKAEIGKPKKEKGTSHQLPKKNKLSIEYGENLVDTKIRVWWEDDHEFYEGVVASFDPDNKKHKVLYDDGDVEILNMKNETWEFVSDETIENKQGDREWREGVSAKIRSRSKAVKSDKDGGKSFPDNDQSIRPKRQSKSHRGKLASKSKSKTRQLGSRSDRKGRKRS